MLKFSANKVVLTRLQTEPITSGSVNAYICSFELSKDWYGLDTTVVFKCGDMSKSVFLDGSDCLVPWEVLSAENAGKALYVGVYGSRGGEEVLPTIWALAGKVLAGTEPAEDAKEPTPSVYDQLTGMVSDAIKACETASAKADAVRSVLDSLGLTADMDGEILLVAKEGK